MSPDHPSSRLWLLVKLYYPVYVRLSNILLLFFILLITNPIRDTNIVYLLTYTNSLINSSISTTTQNKPTP